MASFAIGVILSLTAAVGWGSAMVIFKVGVKDVDFLAAGYIRGLIVIPFLISLGFIFDGITTYAKLMTYPNILWVLLGALFLGLGDVFSLLALQKIDVSISQPITAIYPIFTTLTLLIAKIEDITWFIIGGTLLITAGVIIISYFSQKNEMNNNDEISSQESELKDEKPKRRVPAGILISIIAAFFWGVAIVFNRVILEDPSIEVIPLMGLRNGLMVVGIALFVFIRFFTNREKYAKKIFAPKKEVFLLMGGGLISWCVGGVSFFTAVSMIGAGVTTPISSISPLVVLILGTIFLKEKLTIPKAIGILIIILGSIVLAIPEMLS